MMRCKNGFRLLIVGGMVFWAGCSAQSSQIFEDEGFTTTGVSTAAGAVVGAGLGAIVGSQVGSAGGGLAIGTLAGAAAGAAIGNSLENQENELLEQKKTIARQQEVTYATGREIRKTRDSLDDTLEKNNRSSNAYVDRELNQYQGNPRAQLYVPAGTPNGETFSPTQAVEVVQMPSGKSNVPKLTAPKSTTPSMVAPTLQSEPIIAAQEVPQKKSIPEKKLPASSDGEDILLTPAVSAPSKVSSGLPPAKTQMPAPIDLTMAEDAEIERASQTTPSPAKVVTKTETTKKVEEKTTLSATSGKTKEIAKVTSSSGECERAKSEREKAQSAVADTDRLFYYRRALRLCPSEASYHFEIGRLYQSLGRKKDAEREYRQVLDLNPSHQEAREELVNLQPAN